METVFTIPILGGIEVNESVVITWIIIAVLSILSFVFVRDLKISNPGKKQIALESVIGWIRNFFQELLGAEGRPYIPYLMVIALYLAVSNLIGIIGFKPPTKDMNVTAALAFMSIILIEFSGFREKGIKRFMKSFAEPMALILPFNILEVFVKPVSLCMRLFGNILGGFVVMELIKLIIPVIVPVPFSFYFDVFDGLIQAYIFVFLTALFIRESIE